MIKVKILNTNFTNYKNEDIIDLYSVEEVLNSNINDLEKDWIKQHGYKFIGYCLSSYPNLTDDTIDFIGMYEKDVLLLTD